MLNYNHLRYFWIVAKEGHLTRAAESLNLSQSALSTQIKKLEESLGHALFERRGRSLALTEAGQIALDHSEAIFATGDEMIGRLRNAERLSKKILRVGALSTLSRNFQIGFLRPAVQDPGIEVIIRSGTIAELLAALEAHRLDVVLVNQVPLRDSATPWSSRIIAEQDISLVGTPGRLRGRSDLVDLLTSEPVILPTADSGYRNGVDVMFEQISVSPTVAAEVDDMAMMRLLTREDIGLAILPPIVVTDELANGRLVEACKLNAIQETFAAITMKQRLPNPALEILFESIELDSLAN